MRGKVAKKKAQKDKGEKGERRKKPKDGKDERVSKTMTMKDKNISLSKIEKYLDSIQKDASAVSVKPKGAPLKKSKN